MTSEHNKASSIYCMSETRCHLMWVPNASFVMALGINFTDNKGSTLYVFLAVGVKKPCQTNQQSAKLFKRPSKLYCRILSFIWIAALQENLTVNCIFWLSESRIIETSLYAAFLRHMLRAL